MAERDDPFVVLVDLGEGLKLVGEFDTSAEAEAELKFFESEDDFVAGTVIGAHYSAMRGQ